MRRTKTRLGGPPARPGQEEHAQAHTRGTRVWRPPTRNGRVSAFTQNSPGAPPGSPVERQTVRETGHISDRVHTRQTTAAHAAQDRSRRDPPGRTPSWGLKRVPRGASPAPLLRQGPVTGTMSPVLSWPPRAPRSRSVKRHGRRCQGKPGPQACIRHPQPVGSGPGPHPPRTGSLAWESPAPDAPHPGKRRPSPRGALVPPPQRAKPAHKTTLCGGDD